MKKFIDVSEYQANKNVGEIAKKNNYSGVLIRSGSGVGIDDTYFQEHVENCKTNNIKYGFYHYGYIGWSGTNTPKNEAEYFIKLIKKYYYDGIVLAYDLEENCTKSAKDVYVFCEIVQKEFPKAYVMIYTNENHFKRLGIDENKFAIWFAKPDEIEKNNTPISNISAKQFHFGEHGGQLGDIDLNADYKDIFNIINKNKKECYDIYKSDYNNKTNLFKYDQKKIKAVEVSRKTNSYQDKSIKKQFSCNNNKFYQFTFLENVSSYDLNLNKNGTIKAGSTIYGNYHKHL